MHETLTLLAELELLAARVDEAALEAARILAEDFLAVAVAGSRGPEGRAVLSYASKRRAAGPCAIAGRAESFDAATAALITGISGYSIGLTDTHTTSITHPGPSVVPAALAVAQELGRSGRELLTAIVLGCEAVVRIGAVVNPSHRARGFHPTATCNVFGATIAAAWLMRLDRAQLANALGIAGSMAGGLYEFRHEGSMVMAFHAGWPAQNGIIAAELAGEGYTGPATVLEGPEGFFRAFADRTSPQLLAVDPDRPGILEIGLRPYNACRYGHSGIDALKALRLAPTPEPDDVEELLVWTHKTAVDQETEPTTVVGARLSTAFTVAHALVHGPKVDEVTQADLDDPAIRAVLGRTRVLEDPALTAMFPQKWSCRVQLRFQDGTHREAQVDIPSGEPGNPMSPGQRSEKFHRLVDPVLGRTGAALLEAEFASLAAAPNVARLCRGLAGMPLE